MANLEINLEPLEFWIGTNDCRILVVWTKKWLTTAKAVGPHKVAVEQLVAEAAASFGETEVHILYG